MEYYIAIQNTIDTLKDANKSQKNVCLWKEARGKD